MKIMIRIQNIQETFELGRLFRVETCADQCGLNRSDEAASTAADDD